MNSMSPYEILNSLKNKIVTLSFGKEFVVDYLFQFESMSKDTWIVYNTEFNEKDVLSIRWYPSEIIINISKK